jgi:hypothetical protein
MDFGEFEWFGYVGTNILVKGMEQMVFLQLLYLTYGK